MKRILVMVLTAVLVACAHSPQQVTINPVLSMSGDPYGNNRPVNVAVDDQRKSKSIGSRGGVYSETSVITIQNDLDQAILAAAKGKLAVLGFNVNSGIADATAMTIVIDDISYQPINTSIGNNIEVQAVMQSELQSQGETFTARYTSKVQRQTLMAPDEEDNSEMLSELISKTMNRMFADPELKAFLSNI